MSRGRLVDPKYEDAPCRGEERDAPVMDVQIIVGLLDLTSDWWFKDATPDPVLIVRKPYGSICWFIHTLGVSDTLAACDVRAEPVEPRERVRGGSGGGGWFSGRH
jgi:hypothetical protein